MRNPFVAIAAAFLASLLLASAGGAQQYSELWGEQGELWEPGRPLNDFSDQAGYRGGTVPLPRREIRVSVKDFGAVGDGEADDTQAIIDAIEACPESGAVFIPVGRYKITDWIRLKNLQNVTIRGEDMFETELWFPLGLEDIHSAPTRTTGNIPTTRYSWGGGFFWFDDAEEVGIENLSFIFPDRPYEEHFKERGYNMICLDGTNCWIKNIRGCNADSGIYIHGQWNTLTNILLDAYPGRPRQTNSIAKNHRAGHHAIDIQGGDHNLVEKYQETIKYIHSLGSENHATWNVWHRCKGPNIEIDHHSAGTQNNLFTDIDMGLGLGAEGQRSIHTHAVKETYWNLRSTQILPFDPTSSGIRQGIPLIPDENKTIIVGWWLEWPESEMEKRYEDGPWYEYIGNQDDVRPRNIYLAQLKRRLGVDNLPPDVEITSPITGAMMTAPTVDIRVMIDDRDGADARVVVQLLVNGENFPGVATTARCRWTVPVQTGTSYEITVRARDNAGQVTSDAVTFTTSDELTEGGETILNLD